VFKCRKIFYRSDFIPELKDPDPGPDPV